MNAYFSHGDDFRYEPWKGVPEPIKRIVEDVADSARRSYEAGKLLREVLGPNTEELHPFDEILLKASHR